MAGENVGKVSKAAAAGLTVVKAHPVVFGIVVTVAVGILIYQFVKSKKKEKALTYSSERTSHHCENMYYYDPETKSVTNSAVPVSNASDNNLRKRQVMPKGPSSGKNHTESLDNKQNNLSDSKNVQSASIGNNQNTDHDKVLPDKNLDTAMSVEEKINEYFLRNISETDSISSDSVSLRTDTSTKSNEKKFSNDSSHHCCNCESHSDENSDTLSSCSVSSSSDNVPSEKSTENFKRAYLEEMCRVLNEDINNANEIEVSRAPSVCSVISVESESSVGTLLSGDSELCRGCEENAVNTCTQPCNHRYMCSDCAMRIFRLYKKCKICRTRIERIVVEE